jgi:hypothetical protein
MSLQITNNNNKAQETFLKQLEGLALARDILTSKNLNKDAECDTMTYKSTSCELSMTKKVILPKEAMQLLSNLEALKEAGKAYFQRNSQKALPDHISEFPKFHEAKEDKVELSDSTKETFARIVIRVREEFVEEQIERANFYNIPYETYGDNYYQLMQDIDQYEYLLEKAKDYCVDWDTSEYEPLALEQELEEAEHNAYMHDQELRSYYSQSRGLEV